jgi:hypothetical protein
LVIRNSWVHLASVRGKLQAIRVICAESYDANAVKAAVERQQAAKDTVAAAVSVGKKHDWMHHFAAYRLRQAEAAAAAACRQVRSSCPDPPNTFKRFLDGEDQSAFAQLGFKHLRRPDGGFVPLSAAFHDPKHVNAAAQCGQPGGSNAARASSDGAAMNFSQPSAMSPSEAAVVELFVSASRGPQGPALSAPAQLDEHMARTCSDQTLTQPSTDAMTVADVAACHVRASRLAAALSPTLSAGVVSALEKAVEKASGPMAGSPQPSFARAATMPAGCIPGPAVLETMESVDTVHHPGGSQPSPVSAPILLPDLPWEAWQEQLKIYVAGCGSLPETGELGQWCSDQIEGALHLAAGSLPTATGMSREKYALLTAIPAFAQHLSVIERQVFSECLWRLSQFVESHGRMPCRWHGVSGLGVQEQGEKELADWSAMQRRLAVRLAAGSDCGQMSQDRVRALIQVPGWMDVLC